MTPYSDEDVWVLVKAVNDFLNAPWHDNRQEIMVLNKAVRRFPKPDPDEQVIEKMAESMYYSHCPSADWESTTLQESYKSQARAALTAYRQHMEEQG